MKKLFVLSLAMVGLWFITKTPIVADSSLLENVKKLRVPEGFSISLYKGDLPNARTMVLGDAGTVFVGTRTAGKLYAIRNGKSQTIASDLNMPNGLAYHEKSLFIADVDKLYRIDDIENKLQDTNQDLPLVLIRDDLPSESNHGWRYIDFGPDGRLYMAVGAPCNVCEEEGFATIISMNANGSDERVEARGVRNSVGFTWHPDTKQLWFTDNGRDMMGDDIPPDEINVVTNKGEHFGFPYCHGGMVIDDEFDSKPCHLFTSPIWPLGAHVAPLGIKFYTGNSFPQKYQKQLFIAEHGSWNRSEKSGYRVMMAQLHGNQVKYDTFVSGWLEDEVDWGRPAYVLVLDDGSLLISDDKAGAIYQVKYTGS